MIDRTHKLSITQQAELLDVSRGAVYYQPRPIPAADLILMRHIDELHLRFPFMGVRMLRDELQKQGLSYPVAAKACCCGPSLASIAIGVAVSPSTAPIIDALLLAWCIKSRACCRG